MEEKSLGFNESQLSRTGFMEAFTPKLKMQMEQSAPMIQHNFKKEYDGDQVEATLHLKKSATSDYYFLNKFDLQLQKDGQTETLKQTFYLTRRPANSEDDSSQNQKHENRYTLQRGIQFISRSPGLQKPGN